MPHNNEAFNAMDSLVAGITPYTHFPVEEDRTAVVEAMVAGEHLLLGGTPGGGKTTIAEALAGASGLSVGRHQGDPMTTTKSILGYYYFDMSNGKNEFVRGPIFNDIFLADELNRNTGETQAALIEAMEQKRVTVTGKIHELSPHFTVIATQNMKDKTDGINQLTEANLDRFAIFLDLSVSFDEDDAVAVSLKRKEWEVTGGPKQCIETDELIAAKEAVANIKRNAETDRVRHAQRLVIAVREHGLVNRGESSLEMGRPALKLMSMAAARAAFEDRKTLDEVDINHVAKYVLGHRIEPTLRAQKDGVTPQDIVAQVIADNNFDFDI